MEGWAVWELDVDVEGELEPARDVLEGRSDDVGCDVVLPLLPPNPPGEPEFPGLQ